MKQLWLRRHLSLIWNKMTHKCPKDITVFPVLVKKIDKNKTKQNNQAQCYHDSYFSKPKPKLIPFSGGRREIWTQAPLPPRCMLLSREAATCHICHQQSVSCLLSLTATTVLTWPGPHPQLTSHISLCPTELMVPQTAVCLRASWQFCFALLFLLWYPLVEFGLTTCRATLVRCKSPLRHMQPLLSWGSFSSHLWHRETDNTLLMVMGFRWHNTLTRYLSTK